MWCGLQRGEARRTNTFLIKIPLWSERFKHAGQVLCHWLCFCLTNKSLTCVCVHSVNHNFSLPRLVLSLMGSGLFVLSLLSNTQHPLNCAVYWHSVLFAPYEFHFSWFTSVPSSFLHWIRQDAVTPAVKSLNRALESHLSVFPLFMFAVTGLAVGVALSVLFFKRKFFSFGRAEFFLVALMRRRAEGFFFFISSRSLLASLLWFRFRTGHGMCQLPVWL